MKILMHICCAPCSVFPIEILRRKGYIVDGIFFNPNIHPASELERRMDTLKTYSEYINLNVHYFNESDQEKWESFDNKDERCNYCYKTRLEKAFMFAKNNGYGAVTTSLLVSPYQNHDLIKKICENLSGKYSIPFCYEDFRTGYRKGQEIARDIGLYRQKYCGCVKSLGGI